MKQVTFKVDMESFKDKIEKRQESNRLILNKLSEYVEKYPDIRFGQLLADLRIIQYTAAGSVMDPWNDESVDILRRIEKCNC